MEVKTSIEFGEALIVNSPFSFDDVAVFVPFTETVTPRSGLLSSFDTICPVILADCEKQNRGIKNKTKMETQLARLISFVSINNRFVAVN